MKLDEFVELGEVLGQGNYGIVRSCTVKQGSFLDTDRTLACKTIKWNTIRSNVECRAIQTEIGIMELARGHPHIVNLEHVQKDESGIHIFMEICDGDLFTDLKKKGSFPEAEAKNIFIQLVHAVAFLHINGIVHRDLKLDNVLIKRQRDKVQLIGDEIIPELAWKLPPYHLSEVGSASSSASDFDMETCFSRSDNSCELDPELILKQQSNDRPCLQVKLTDFGLSTSVEDIQCSEVAGSPFYLAPEVLKLIIVQQTGTASRSNLQPYGPAMDVWSLGIILYSLFTGRFPFPGQSPLDLYRSIKSGALKLDSPAFSCVSDEAKGLIQKLLSLDVAARPSIHDVLNDPWLCGASAPKHRWSPRGTNLQNERMPAVEGVCRFLKDLEEVKTLQHQQSPISDELRENFSFLNGGQNEHYLADTVHTGKVLPPNLSEKSRNPKLRVSTSSLWAKLKNRMKIGN